jgi:hypothetical protein
VELPGRDFLRSPRLVALVVPAALLVLGAIDGAVDVILLAVVVGLVIGLAGRKPPAPPPDEPENGIYGPPG